MKTKNTRFIQFIIVMLAGLFPGQAIKADTVLVETEQFSDPGGWVLDQQFMDLMGSPFMLAHGMGTPVADATTTVEFPAPGKYQVWVRTRDWVAPWNAPGAPGKFELMIDGTPIKTIFGTEGAEWHWQPGGEVVVGESASLAIHDLTGFEGRCDAIVFSNEKGWVPPNEAQALAQFRRKSLGLPDQPTETKMFDLVVVGGGMAGTAAAVTAARRGLSVALIQDRPVLGGNSSSEVRVWPEGHVNQMPFPRLGDVVMELVPTKRSDSKNAQNAAVFDDDRKLRLAKSEPNITLFLEQRMNDAHANNGTIQWVICQHIRSAERTRIRGRLFLDSTGDGSLGFLAGADFDQTEKKHMGASNLWNIKCLCEDDDPLSSEMLEACETATFPRCPWAVDLTNKPFPGRTDGGKTPKADVDNRPISLGNWFWESGFDRDPINDMERIRDQNFRAMYGAWDVIKNVEKRYPAHRLNWVAYIAGKRESRRLMGDYVLTAEDLRDDNQFPDGCFPCTWGIDTHFPSTKYKEGHAGDEFIADYTHGEGYTYKGPYWVPYRCLYSRNINNLFMAGRDISVTHEALGAVRVMKTTGAMGEIVGMAASVCKIQGCNPRDVYAEHFSDLRLMMETGTGKHEPILAAENGGFELAARQALTSGKQIRYEADQDSLGYWRSEGDSAQWFINVPSAGEFKLLLEWSCADKDAGGQFEVRVGAQSAPQTFKVKSTKAWSDFEFTQLGIFKIPKGNHSVIVSSKKSDGPLMKLRSVKIIRVDVDWLVKPALQATEVDVNESGNEISMTNGLIRRTWRIAPNAATVGFDNLMTGESILRGVKPEAVVEIDGTRYDVGGLTGQPNYAFLTPEWIEQLKSNPDAFQFVGHEVGQPIARLKWKRVRHHGPDLKWPPAGKTLRLDFERSIGTPGDRAGSANIRVSVHYEMYDGIPVLSKWITIHNDSNRDVMLNRFTSEILAVVEYGSAVETRSIGISKPNIHVETDYAFSSFNVNDANHNAVHWEPDPDYQSQVNYQRLTPCLLVVQPDIGPQQTIRSGGVFSSFRTFELIYDSYDRERNGLALRRMYRILAPWTTENPLMMHARFADWERVKLAIDQAAEVGFEMVILTFGSGFNIENESPEYLAEMKKYADYAHSKGVEIGGYSLLASRSVGGGNDVVMPEGESPRFGHSPCLHSEWGQNYFRKLREFFPQTGFSLLEHDGSYPGDVCTSANHPGHAGHDDSRWNQWQTIHDYYQWCRENGIYLNVPDYYYMSGSNKCGMGYREVNWSLPRAQQVIHTRQNIFDGSWEKLPSMGWMFVPLTQYHGGGAAATIEPLDDHLEHYERMMMSNLALGVQACYRGPRLYDTDRTREMVTRSVDWFKKYRGILESDVIHGRRADGRDLDWMLHVNPTLTNKGMLVVFNPLNEPVKKTIRVNLYYTGLTTTAKIRKGEGEPRTYEISRDYKVDIPVDVPPQGMAWFVIE